MTADELINMAIAEGIDVSSQPASVPMSIDYTRSLKDYATAGEIASFFTRVRNPITFTLIPFARTVSL